MCLHYLGKFEVSDWAVNTVIKCAFEWFLSHPLSGRLTHRTSTQLTTPCGVCFRSKSIVARSRTLRNWSDASSASGPLWITRLLTVLLKRDVSVYALAFMLEADILSTHWNKDCVMRHVSQWLFWETITVSYVCCNSVNHSNGDKCTHNYCVNSSIWHFKFPKVVQAHTLGEILRGQSLQFLLKSVHIWQT